MEGGKRKVIGFDFQIELSFKESYHDDDRNDDERMRENERE